MFDTRRSWTRSRRGVPAAIDIPTLSTGRDRPDLLPEDVLPGAVGDETAAKAYSLLVKAMAKAERIGVATFVMRGKQYLAAIRPSDGTLVLETMYFADEVRDSGDGIDNLPVRSRVGGKDLDMAVRLVESLTTQWDPKAYRDTYTERVQQLVDAKKKNREIVLPETAEEAGAGGLQPSRGLAGVGRRREEPPSWQHRQGGQAEDPQA